MNLYQSIVHRLENALNQRSVAWRTQTLTRVIIFGFIVIGVVYISTTLIGQSEQRKIDVLEEYRLTLKKADSDLSQVRRSEKNFYLPIKKDKQKYLGYHQAAITNLFKTLDKIKIMSPDQETENKTNEMIAAVGLYKKTFDESAKYILVAGYNEQTGLHYTLVETARELVAKTPTQSSEILLSLLKLRKHEKDFISKVDNQYHDLHVLEQANFKKMLTNSSLPNKNEMALLFDKYSKTFDSYVKAQIKAQISTEEANKASDRPDDLINELTTLSNSTVSTQEENAVFIGKVSDITFSVFLLVVATLLILLVSMIARGIRQPIQHLQSTIEELANGQDVRTDMTSPDELGELGRSFDRMIEERNAVQQGIIDEYDKLNDAVLNLLQAVAILARKDLTHKLDVTEDVTGPVADALNLLTSETAKVLRRVADLSAEVTQASMQVKEHSDEVMEISEKGGEEADKASKALIVAADSMTKIAAVARRANQSAEEAIKTTRQAMESVNSTVSGINNTRETIRETEKRIKRLGERSQEISLAVNLINSISERTHILALNASMHAASAGEAGRGFAVVADEVQRLAESARQSTQQIASLVHNIQADTAETMSAMNQAIEQVVAGSRLAEQAGQQMEVTEQNTAQLVKAVQQIAIASEAQVRVNRDLVVRAEAISTSSQYTNAKLKEQALQTYSLVEYARGLLSAVRVFKLPD